MNPSDKLTIETPEQIALELPLAGIGSRALSCAFDMLLQIIAIFILIVAVFLIFMLFGILLPRPVIVSGRSLAFVPIIAILVQFLLQWGYFIFFEIRWNGQTPGKRKFQIRVIKESGRPVTATEVIARNLLRPVDALGIYAVGMICMMLNRQNKRLGDYAAGTLVVYDKKPGSSGAMLNVGSASPDAVSTPVRISPEELALIEAWLNRRLALTSAVRRGMADKIASAIRKRTGIEPEDGQSTEDFLESLARKTRDSAGRR